MLDRFAKEKYEIASSLLDKIDGEEIRILLLQITIEASKKNLKNIDDIENDESYDSGTLKRLAESLLFRIVFDKSLTTNEIEAAALVCAYAYETLCPPLLEDKTILSLDGYEFLNRIISSLLYYISGYDPNAEAITNQLNEAILLLNDDQSLEAIVIKQLYNFTRLKMSQVYIKVEAPKVSRLVNFESLEENCRKACLWNLNNCLNELSREYCYIHDIWSKDINSKLLELYLNSSDCNEQTISLLALLLLLFEKMSQGRAISTLKSPSHYNQGIWNQHMSRYISEGVYLIWPPHKDAIQKGLLDLNNNNIIAIPTGTGKSLIAEHKVISYLEQGSVIIYLAPTLALCRQITKNMKKIMDIHNNGKGNSVLVDEIDLFHENINDLNEDIILVMTPEKCVSLIANNNELVAKCTLCVVDEFHNIYHGSRGALLDLLLSRVSQLSDTAFLIMSALLDDSPKLQNWLKKLSSTNNLSITNTKWRPARTLRGFISHPEIEINRAKREAEKSKKKTFKTKLSVQLYFCVQDVWLEDGRQAYPLDLPIKMDVRFKKINSPYYGDSWTVEGYGNDISRQLGNYLASSNMPVMIFSQGTRHLLSEIGKHKKLGVFPQSLTEVTKSYLTLANEELGFVSELNSGLIDGIGIHTQALINEEQLAVEDFFKKSKNGVLCATGTISQGLNLAASAVIVNTTKQYSEQETKPLSKAEVINMLGRAGRPGFGQQSLGIVVPQYPSTTSEKSFSLDKDSTSYLERVDGVEKTTSGLLGIINEIAEKELNEDGIDDNFTLMTNVLGNQSKPLRRDLLRKTLAMQFLEDETFDQVFKKWDSWLDTVASAEKELIIKAAVKSANKASVIEVILDTIDQVSLKELFINDQEEEIWLSWFFECISKLDINFIQQNIHELFTSNEVMIKFLQGWIEGSSILDLAKILHQYKIGTLNEEKLSRSNQTSIAKAIKIIKEGIRNISHIATAYVSIVDLIVNEESEPDELPDKLLSLSSYFRLGVSNDIALSLRKLEIPRKISIQLSKNISRNTSIKSLIKMWKTNGKIDGIELDKNVEKALLVILK
ncbi:DEAD/DEAH box helicase [Priestia sp. AB]|uniref:DEAD/DEAH box helicase n=1 Tax=Priestia sp. AB TaxID=3020890 RepID=UPI00232E9199|nr:DEAD/DEAH box helicase [Priestia sp. AB]MDC0706381.1 DEAD/DEAH box helicase [Priestia sp. AB]